MSRLAPKTKDLGSSAADAAKNKVQKVFPPEALASAVGMVDALALRRATLLSLRLLRDVRAGRDVAVDRVSSTVARRLNDVLRSGENALRDLADLAADTDRVANPSEQGAVASRLRAFQAAAVVVRDSGERILRKLRHDFPGLPDQKMRRALRVLRTRTLAVENLFGRIRKTLDSLGNRDATGA